MTLRLVDSGEVLELTDNYLGTGPGIVEHARTCEQIGTYEMYVATRSGLMLLEVRYTLRIGKALCKIVARCPVNLSLCKSIPRRRVVFYPMFASTRRRKFIEKVTWRTGAQCLHLHEALKRVYDSLKRKKLL